MLDAEHGRRFRHNQQSLRVVEHLERDGAGLNLTWEVRDGILNHTGEGEPATLEGAIVRLVDRFAYVNHDIDDALRAGILDYGELPAAPLELLGAGSSERIDALVHDLVETSDAAGVIVQSPVYADALLELREFHVRPGVPEPAGAARDDPGGRDGRDGLPLLPGSSRRDGRGLRRRRHPSDRLGCGHDRSLLHAGVRRPDRSMSQIKRESVEAVKDAVDMLDLVSGYTQLRGGGANYSGRCPFHDERTPSFSVNPLKKVYFCFGCQASGDEITFVMEKEGLDFNGAIEWLADRYNVRLEYEESSPQEDRRRAERERLLRLLDETATFYARYLWEAAEAEQARAYLDERGITRETAQTYRVGYAPAKGDRLVRPARGQGVLAREELARAGLSAASRPR